MPEKIQQEQNQRPVMDLPKKGDWLSRHAVAGIVFLLLIFMIIAAGVYLWYVAQPVCCQNPVLENEQIHENAAWKTYSNTKFGYGMKYPADWTAKTTEVEDGSYVTLTSPDKRLNVSINYLGTYSDGVYRNATEEERTLIKQILSTFKIIDNTDTSFWKTYRNEDLGFEFEYPVSFGDVTEMVISAKDLSGAAQDCVPVGYKLSIRFSNTNRVSLSGSSKIFNDCFEARGAILSDFNIVNVSDESMEFRQSDNLVKSQKVNIEKRLSLATPNQYGYEFKNNFCEGCDGEISALVLLPSDDFKVLFLEGDQAVIDQILSTFKLRND